MSRILFAAYGGIDFPMIAPVIRLLAAQGDQVAILNRYDHAPSRRQLDGLTVFDPPELKGRLLSPDGIEAALHTFLDTSTIRHLLPVWRGRTPGLRFLAGWRDHYFEFALETICAYDPDLVVVSIGEAESAIVRRVCELSSRALACLVPQRYEFKSLEVFKPHPATTYLVAGEYGRARLIGRGVDPGRILVTGNPRFDRLASADANRRAAASDRAVKRVLIPLQGVSGEERLLELLKRYVSSREGVRVILRRHPNLPLRACVPHMRLAVRGSMSIALRGSLERQLREADVLVSQWSLTVLEALIAGVPVVSWKSDFMPDEMPFASRGDTMPAATYQDLERGLDRLLFDAAFRRAWVEQHHERHVPYTGILDGQSARRVADAIEALAAGRERAADVRARAEPAVDQVPAWLGHSDGGGIVVLNHPDAVKHVLQDEAAKYQKGVLYDDLRKILGLGTLTADGDLWLSNRRTIQPAFHSSALDAYYPVMIESITGSLGEWRSRARAGRAVDIFPVMSCLTLRVIARTLFGVDLGEREGIIARALAELVTFDHRSRGPVVGRAYRYLPLLAKLRALQARRALDESVAWIIRNRSGDHDLIAYFLADSDHADPVRSTRIRDEVATMLIAGHETTAIGLSWALHLLSEHPEAERAIRAELDDVLGGRTPGLADLPRLTYTTLVIKETLRLYPPVPTIARQAVEDDVVGGMRIPAGAPVRIKPVLLHRHPEFWPDGDRFVPERFSADQSAGRPPHVFVPFGAGPRTCIGHHFAMMEMKAALAMILQAAHFRPDRNRPPLGGVTNLTLRPRFGLWMIPDFSSPPR